MSNGNLSVQIQGNIYATLQSIRPLDTIIDNFVQPLAVSLSNGMGSFQANSIFSGQFTVPANGSVVHDMVTFGTAVDGVGSPYANQSVRVFFLQNMTGTNIQYLVLSPCSSTGQKGDNSQGWIFGFNGTHRVWGEGAYTLLSCPGPNGMPVPPLQHYMGVYNEWGVPITYSMMVVGSGGAV